MYLLTHIHVSPEGAYLQLIFISYQTLNSIHLLVKLPTKGYIPATEAPNCTLKFYYLRLKLLTIELSSDVHVLIQLCEYRIADYFCGVPIFVIFVVNLQVTKFSTHEFYDR